MDPWLRDRYAGVELDEGPYRRRRGRGRVGVSNGSGGAVERPMSRLERRWERRRQAGGLDAPVPESQRQVRLVFGARAWAWFLLGVVVGMSGLMFVLIWGGVLVSGPR